MLHSDLETAKHLKVSVMDLMESWWQELQNATKPDQLSLPYAMWMSGLAYNFMEESARLGKGYLGYSPHKDFIDRPFVNKLKDKLVFTFRRIYIYV